MKIYLLLLFVTGYQFQNSTRLKSVNLYVNGIEKYFWKVENRIIFHVNVKDEVVILFKKAHVNDRMKCSFRSSITQFPADELFGNKTHSQLHFSITPHHGHQNLYCTANSLKMMFYDFFVFITPTTNSNFYLNEPVTTGSDNYLSCITSVFQKDVKLKVDGKNSSIPYTPMKGFLLNAKNTTRKSYYECVYGDEVSSVLYGTRNCSNYGSLHSTDIDMTHSQQGKSHTIQCIFKNFKKQKDIEMFISCQNRSLCTNQYTFSVDKMQVSELKIDIYSRAYQEHFVCVFVMKNCTMVLEKLIVHKSAFGQLRSSIFILALVVGCVAVMTSCYICYSKNKKINSAERLHNFRAELIDTEKWKLIGSGHSAKTYKLELKNGLMVAVKHAQNNKKAQNEAKILAQLGHANIVHLIGVAFCKKPFWFFNKPKMKYLILPYFHRGSLTSYLTRFTLQRHDDDDEKPLYFRSNNGAILTASEMTSYVFQISRALHHMHERDITHRDISCKNVVLANDGVVKLIDFELAQKGDTKIETITEKLIAFLQCVKAQEIPLDLYPLEALRYNYFKSSDVWSFGLIILEIFSFGGRFKADHSSIEEAKNQLELNGYVPVQPLACPDSIFNNVVKPCLAMDHTKRKNISDCRDSLSLYLRQQQQLLESKYKEDYDTEDGIQIHHAIKKVDNLIKILSEKDVEYEQMKDQTAFPIFTKYGAQNGRRFF